MRVRAFAIVVWAANLAALAAIAACVGIVLDLIRGGVAVLSIFGGGVL